MRIEENKGKGENEREKEEEKMEGKKKGVRTAQRAELIGRAAGIYTSHIHWVARGTGTPKNRDEVNRREVSESCSLGEDDAHFGLEV